MSEAVFFYRKPGSAEFEKSAVEKQPVPFRLKSPFEEKTTVYDFTEGDWNSIPEAAELPELLKKFNDHKLQLAEYLEESVYPEKPEFENLPYTEDEMVLEDLSPSEMKEFMDFRYGIGKFNFNKSRATDSNKISLDYFGAKLESDKENFLVKISFFKFFRNDDFSDLAPEIVDKDEATQLDFTYSKSSKSSRSSRHLYNSGFLHEMQNKPKALGKSGQEAPVFLEQTMVFDVKNGDFYTEVIPFSFCGEKRVSGKPVNWFRVYKYDHDLFNDRKKKNTTSGRIYREACVFLSDQEWLHLPRGILKEAHQKLLEIADAFTGIRVSSFVYRREEDEFYKQWNADLLDNYDSYRHVYWGFRVGFPENYLEEMLRITKLPFEPNLCSVIFSSEYEDAKGRFKYKRNDSRVLNHFFEKNHIRGYRILRKYFSVQPDVILAYMRLKKCGFKDLNLYNRVFETKKSIEMIMDTDLASFVFFSKYCISHRSEIATLNILLRSEVEPDDDIVDTRFYIRDGIMMFTDYFKHIPEALRKDIIYQGFTEFNHDALSNISYKVCNPNIKFRYSEKQKKLEDEIDGLKFRLPVNSDQLCEIGTCLHNCVASYADKVKKHESTIVYAEKDGQYKICIEIKDGLAVQERVDRNKRPDPEMRGILSEWHNRHGIRGQL